VISGEQYLRCLKHVVLVNVAELVIPCCLSITVTMKRGCGTLNHGTVLTPIVRVALAIDANFVSYGIGR